MTTRTGLAVWLVLVSAAAGTAADPAPIDPVGSAAAVARARAAGKNGEQDRVLWELDEAIRLDQTNADAWSRRGAARGWKGEYDQALRDCLEALRLDPMSAWAFIRRGLVWGERGDWNKAFADLDHAVVLDPKNYKTYSYRGEARARNGEMDKALADFNEAIRLAPNEAEPYHDRAGVWVAKRERDKALADLERAIQLDPSSALTYYARATLWAEKGAWSKALADLDRSIQLDPKNAEAFHGRGSVLIRTGAVDIGIADLDRAIELNPNNAGALWDRGGAWAQKREWEKATQDMERVVKLDPGLRAAALAAIRAWKEQGAAAARATQSPQPQDEREKWTQLVGGYTRIPSVSAPTSPPDAAAAHTPLPEAPQAQPGAVVMTPEQEAGIAQWMADGPDGIYRRGLGYARKGEWGAALRVFERVLWKDENHAPALIYRAWLRAICPDPKLRDAAAALADAKRACELTGWANPGYFEVIAAAYAEAGMYENAAEWQRAALCDTDYARAHGDPARERLKLYEQNKPARAR